MPVLNLHSVPYKLLSIDYHSHQCYILICWIHQSFCSMRFYALMVQAFQFLVIVPHAQCFLRAHLSASMSFCLASASKGNRPKLYRSIIYSSSTSINSCNCPLPASNCAILLSIIARYSAFLAAFSN